MQYTTYEEGFAEYNMTSDSDSTYVPNTIITMMQFIKNIVIKFGRGKGYINHMSQDKDPRKAFDVLEVLNAVLIDNEVFIGEKALKNYKLLQEYTQLIINNRKEIIRENPNIIYSEDDSEDPKLNCNMIDAMFSLIFTLSQQSLSD